MTDFASGQMVPGTQYRIVRMLGAGGHGSVYEVEHTFLEAKAVMKVLHGDLAEQTDLANRMTREAKTLAKLRHPNIVEVRDGGLTAERPPRPFFVMEPLRGLTLRELIKQVPHGLGVTQSLDIAIGMLSGLHYAHTAGVVHRDVKPDNVFMHRGSDEHRFAPKLLDFGIAHLVLGKRLTGRYFLGTPRYASPEQLRSEELSPQTDIYAVGLVLHEMLTGQAPYAQLKDIGAIMNAHLNDTLPAVEGRVAGAPPVLDKFLAQMLAKDATKRPPTAFAAAVALREIRGVADAMQSGAVESPYFKTEPTPMENVLTEASPDEMPIVTEVGPPAGESDTIPDGMPLFVTKPLATNGALAAIATTEPADPARDARRHQGGIDRQARTNTAERRVPERAPANGTDIIPPDELSTFGIPNPTAKSKTSDDAPQAQPAPSSTFRSVGNASTTDGIAMSRPRSSRLSPRTRARFVTFGPVAVSILLGLAVIIVALKLRRSGAQGSSLQPSSSEMRAGSVADAPPSRSNVPPIPSASTSASLSRPSTSAGLVPALSTSSRVAVPSPSAHVEHAPPRSRSTPTGPLATPSSSAQLIDPAQIGF